jgi:DNA-3-methyladenine glycosylase I
MMKKRCEWPSDDELMLEYHDTEWGVPVHDDRKHFEFLLLDAFQAGLSWSIILKKRENFRKAFDNFEPVKISRYREAKIQKLLFLKIQKEFGSFDKFIWQFTGGKQKVNGWKKMKDIPAKSPESDAMSKELKKRGFKFVGSTICYSYMQAAGMVNDHTIYCFRHREVTPESDVTLREVTKDTVRAICNLKVSESQNGFVAPNAVSIAQAYFAETAWFRAIYADDTPVGFLMLYKDTKKPE